MKRIITKIIMPLIGVAILFPESIYGQNKLTVNAKADFVSDYIWRGADQNSGFSVQPSLSLRYSGFNINI
jgi:hypothetical protein